MDITNIFYKLADCIDLFLEEWIEENQNENKIPNHYDNLHIIMDLKDNFFLDINLQKTNNQRCAYYNDFESIKNAYKKANIIIGKKNSLKAYNVHARNRLGVYELVSYDIKRILSIDEKVNGSEYINNLYPIIESKKPIKETNRYPYKLRFGR